MLLRTIFLSWALLSSCSPPAVAPSGSATHVADGDVSSAVAAGRAYLEKVDASDFVHAYAMACGAKPCPVDEATFEAAMKAGQQRLGPILSRTLIGTEPIVVPTPSPRGEVLAITFRTSFEQLPGATETLRMARAESEPWHPIGYGVQPQDCPASVQVPTSTLPPPPARLALDPFYKKYVEADGVPVVSSAMVSDRALLSARIIVRRMLRKRPDLAAQLVAANVRVTIMAPNERTLDVPEHAQLADRPTDTPGVDWNHRARGLGGTPEIPVTSAGEENLLCLPCDRYSGENVLVHEFAHTIADVALANDAAFQRDLETAYQSALAKGLWRGTYAAKNVHEYWAEGAQDWFDTNLHDVPEHNEIHTRAMLATYDPALYALLARVFVDDGWRYDCSRVEE